MICEQAKHLDFYVERFLKQLHKENNDKDIEVKQPKVNIKFEMNYNEHFSFLDLKLPKINELTVNQEKKEGEGEIDELYYKSNNKLAYKGNVKFDKDGQPEIDNCDGILYVYNEDDEQKFIYDGGFKYGTFHTEIIHENYSKVTDVPNKIYATLKYSKGKVHSKVKVYKKTVVVFEGCINYGNFHNICEFFYENGKLKYKAMFKNGMIEKSATLYDKNQSILADLNFQYNPDKCFCEPNGLGILYYPQDLNEVADKRSCGPIKKDQLNMLLRCIWKNGYPNDQNISILFPKKGVWFKGDLVDGQRQGAGEIFFAPETKVTCGFFFSKVTQTVRYHGIFHDGVRDGYGILYNFAGEVNVQGNRFSCGEIVTEQNIGSVVSEQNIGE